MLRTLPPSAATVMQAQHGVATASQLQVAGMTQRQLAAAVRRGLLVRPRRGIYVDRAMWRAASDVTRHAMRLLAVQLVTTDAVGIGSTAAMTWQLPLRRRPDRLLVARDASAGLVAGARVVRLRRGAPACVLVEGLRVTGLADTAAYVAAHADCLSDALITMDAALRRGAAADDLHSAVAALPTARQRERAERAFQHADPWSESWLESLSRGCAIDLKVPEPLCNVTLVANDREARADQLWPELGVIGEADGRGKYEDQARPAAEVHWQEKRRREWLEEIGFEVARWGTAEVAPDGRPMLRRLARAMTRQRQLPFRWPDGVAAELRCLPGVVPPPRVVAEVARLASLGFPIRFADPDPWASERDVPSLWTPRASRTPPQVRPV